MKVKAVVLSVNSEYDEGIREGSKETLFIPQMFPQGPQCARHCSVLSVGIAHISVRDRL